MKRLRLTLLFALVSLVAISVAAFVVYRVSGDAATHRLMQAAERDAAREAAMFLDDLRTERARVGGIAGSTSGEVLTLEHLAGEGGLPNEFAEHAESLKFIKGFLYDVAGRVVWASEPKSNVEPVSEQMFAAALEGGLASVLERGRKVTGLDGETHRMDVMETYVPVRESADGPVIGVFETYKDATEEVEALTAGAGDSAARRTVYTMGGLFLVLLGFIVAAHIAMYRARDREREAREQLEERNRRLSDTEAQLQREARESATLAEIGRSVSSSLDIDEVYERVAQAVCAVLPVDWIEIVRIHQERAIATRVAGSGDIWPLQREIALAGTIAGGAIDTAETLLALSDTPEELLERFPGVDPHVAASCRSIVAAPLIYESSVVGALLLLTAERQAYSKREQALAERVAAQIAGAVVNAQLHITVDRQAREEAVLAEIGRIVSSSLDIEETYARFAHAARTLIPADRVAILLAGPDAEGLTLTYVDGTEVPGAVPGAVLPFPELVRSQLRSGGGLISDGAAFRHLLGDAAPVYASVQFESVISMPLVWRDEFAGLLSFLASRRDAYDGSHLKLASRIAAQIAGVVANAELHAATVRARAELAQHAAALEAAANMIVITDRDGTIQYVNEAFTRHTGYTKEEAIGQNPRALNSGQQDAKFYEDMWDTILAGRVWDGTLVNRRKDGSEYPERMTITPLRDEAGAISRFIAIKQDITEAVEAEAALRIRGAAVDSALDAMIVADRDGMITLANPAAQRMFAKPGVDLAGQPLDAIIPEELREAHRAGLKRVAAGGTPRVLGSPVTLEALAADGSRFPIEVSLGRVEGAKDGAFVATIRDITERKRREAEDREREKLAAELRELQRLSKAHSEFLSTVSHELKTPLTSVLAFADILARNRGQNFTERQRQHLGMIQRNGRRLGALIDDLLDVSRVDTGRLKLEPIEFDVRALLDEIAESFKPMLADKGQTLQTDFPPGGTGLRADRNRLAQVVLNLLNNASKYSPEASRIEARAWVEEERLYIQVRDHGIGISRRDQGKLFTAFFRADNTETRSESGTGLGLLIVKSIVELHGGEVSLESERGKGTAVRLWVPGLLADALEASEEKAPQQPTSRLAA